MSGVWGIAALKLILSVATFALLGYLGKSHDKRIAGVLLTFPILNGIGILTAHDPHAAANSIYAVVVFNGLLLFAAISFYRVLPPLPESSSAHVKLIARVTTWTVLWALGATAVVVWRDRLPGPAALLVVVCGIAVAASMLAWKTARRHASHKPPPHIGTQAHARGLLIFWCNGAGLVRMGLFTFCCILLLVAANVFESKWVGMLSALPLPGLFAVATLSTVEADEDFGIIRQTVFWGPVTVVAFNWIYAEAVTRLPAGAHAAGGLTLLVLLLAADASLIFWAVPRLSAYLDSRLRLSKATS